MEFGAVLKELTYKSVCLFFIFSYSFFAVACVAQHEEDKAIAVSEMCIFKKVLYNIPSFFNRHRGKYSYCLTIYASNGTISKEGLKNKLDRIVKTITLLMKREDIILYDFQIYYYSENMNTSFHYEIGEN